MNDPAILFIKPKSISVRDKKTLQNVGIIVVETENPQDVKFTRARMELDSGALLACAAQTISSAYSDEVRKLFGAIIAKKILDRAKQK